MATDPNPARQIGTKTEDKAQTSAGKVKAEIQRLADRARHAQKAAEKAAKNSARSRSLLGFTASSG